MANLLYLPLARLGVSTSQAQRPLTSHARISWPLLQKQGL